MKLKTRIEQLISELGQTEYFKTHFVKALEDCLTTLGHGRKLEHIVCYGLGTFSATTEMGSRYQLALLILMHNHLLERGHPLNESIEIYDPFFKDTDKEVLLKFERPKFTLIEKNEFCARELSPTGRAKSCVLFFMPHMICGFYNNLIGANWKRRNLDRLIILGNSFQEMIGTLANWEQLDECLYYVKVLVDNFETVTRPKVNKKLKRKNKLLEPITTTEIVTDNKEKALIEKSIGGEFFDDRHAFNSLAFHLINQQWMAKNPGMIEKYKKRNWTCIRILETDADRWDD